MVFGYEVFLGLEFSFGAAVFIFTENHIERGRDECPFWSEHIVIAGKVGGPFKTTIVSTSSLRACRLSRDRYLGVA